MWHNVLLVRVPIKVFGKYSVYDIRPGVDIETFSKKIKWIYIIFLIKEIESTVGSFYNLLFSVWVY